MTDRYALFGNPIGHSKSPQIHAAFARALGHDVEYGLIEAPVGPPSGFPAAALAFRDGGGRGGNVTTPFKLEALALATERLPRAEQAGAANCLKFEPDGRIAAEMFDGVGLVHDIEHNLGLALRGRRVLVLGAGGAARGCIAPILEQAPSQLVVANRSPDKAVALAALFATHGPVAACGLHDLAGERFDLVVNATSAALKGQPLDLPPGLMRGAAMAYDMTYGRGLTTFLRAAREAGVPQLADGVGMLVEQAAHAWVWWRGVRPDTRSVIEHLTVPLA